VWNTVSQTELDQLKVLVSNINLKNQNTSPHLSATIQNNSLFSIPSVNVVALLYDGKGNAVSASSTYLDILGGGQSTDINFTWPEPMSENVVSEEIIPMYNIFLAKLE
jgi:hypothetical protein